MHKSETVQLDESQQRALKAFYSTQVTDQSYRDYIGPINWDQVDLVNIKAFARYCSSEGVVFGSKMSREGNRLNSLVKVNLLVDKNAARMNAPIIMSEEAFFFNVYFYFQHTINGRKHFLAMVKERKQKQINDNYCQLKFLQGDLEKAYSVVEACHFESMCGLLKTDSHTIVLDHGFIYNIH